MSTQKLLCRHMSTQYLLSWHMSTQYLLSRQSHVHIVATERTHVYISHHGIDMFQAVFNPWGCTYHICQYRKEKYSVFHWILQFNNRRHLSSSKSRYGNFPSSSFLRSRLPHSQTRCFTYFQILWLKSNFLYFLGENLVERKRNKLELSVIVLFLAYLFFRIKR